MVTLAPALAAQTSRFTVDTADGLHANVTLTSLETAGDLQIRDGSARHKLTRVIEIQQVDRKLPLLPTRDFLLLTNGDRLPLDREDGARLDEGRLHVWPTVPALGWHDKGVNLFAPYAVLLFWSLPEGVDDAHRFFAQLAEEPRKRDAVYLKNGDRLEGSLVTLNKAGCTIATDRKKIDVASAQLAGIAWNTERQARVRPKKPYYRAALEGGARVNLAELRFDDAARKWLGTTQFGPPVELPESSVLAIDTRLGPAVDLSDLPPAKYEQRPFLGPPWPLAKDAAADGNPLRIGGYTFEKGLGTHAPCRVTYALDGKYRRFDTLVGIDEMTSPRGRAKIAVELDGKRIDLNAGKELTSQSASVQVRLDVAHAKSLTLIVETGTFGDVQANVNWAKARLIKRD